MKTKTVDMITNNEDYVRMRIFDGDLPLPDATTELVRLELTQQINSLECQLRIMRDENKKTWRNDTE